MHIALTWANALDEGLGRASQSCLSRAVRPAGRLPCLRGRPGLPDLAGASETLVDLVQLSPAVWLAWAPEMSPVVES